MSKRSIPGATKDAQGMYTPVAAPLKTEDAPSVAPPSPTLDINLDKILEKQLTALDRATSFILAKCSSNPTKDDIQSLATCLKLTMELKTKEKEMLDELTDEDLESL